MVRFSDYLIVTKGPKWPALYDLIKTNSEKIFSYDAILFLDDDIWCDYHEIDEIFRIFQQHDLQLSQPSLTVNSHFSNFICVRNNSFSVRYTNFVENMNPIFSRDSLQRCWKTFNENRSGWGIEYLWRNILGNSKQNIAIIDDVSVEHTRPVGGPLYDLLAASGHDAKNELDVLLEKYDLYQYPHLIHGAVCKNNEVLSPLVDCSEIDKLKFVQQLIGGTDIGILKDRRCLNQYLSANFHLNRKYNSDSDNNHAEGSEEEIRFSGKISIWANLLHSMSDMSISKIIQIGNSDVMLFPLLFGYLDRCHAMNDALLLADNYTEVERQIAHDHKKVTVNKFDGELETLKNIAGVEKYDIAILSSSGSANKNEDVKNFCREISKDLIIVK